MNDKIEGRAPMEGVVRTPDQTRETAACEKALRTILAHIGPWGTQMVLIGGLTPRYLIPELPEGIDPHAGTTDLDVVLSLAVSSTEDAPYRTLQQNLKAASFAPSRNEETGQTLSYAWERRIDEVLVKIEFFCPVEEDATAGTIRRNPGPPQVGSSVGAIRTQGGELAGRDAINVELAGDTLDHGGELVVTLRVANILPFLVLKAFALRDRVKDKDAYDVVWLLNAFPGGPAGAAAAARSSPVADGPDVVVAIAILRERFGSVDSAGSARYANYFLGGNDDAAEGRTRLRRDAHGTVQEFLRNW
jgi:hypothetical protein